MKAKPNFVDSHSKFQCLHVVNINEELLWLYVVHTYDTCPDLQKGVLYMYPILQL